MLRSMRGGRLLSRRSFIAGAGGLVGLAGLVRRTSAAEVDLPFENGTREIVSDFPGKGPMILQRVRPPLLETPFEVFDQGVFTPNDRFYVRWHLGSIPAAVNVAEYRLKVHGQVARPLDLTLDEIKKGFESFEIAAVNQCSGNSRGYFSPRVPGAQWGDGAMGNALWRGVRLKDVLQRAGVNAGAVQVRFRGLDVGNLPQTPVFAKSLGIDHAREGEVMLAYAMNGQPLPLANGFPIRLVVPGWFATYWVKMLGDIEVLDKADDNYWMSKAYLIPDTPAADMAAGQQGVKLVPISRMVPRSFFTSPREGAVVKRGQGLRLRGLAFGGDSGVRSVSVSMDGGNHWQAARLGADHGKYSFRQWEVAARFARAGRQTLMVRMVNMAGAVQPERANWNTGGYMRNVIESIAVQVA